MAPARCWPLITRSDSLRVAVASHAASRSGSRMRLLYSARRSHTVCTTSSVVAGDRRKERATDHTRPAKRSTSSFQADSSPSTTRASTRRCRTPPRRSLDQEGSGWRNPQSRLSGVPRPSTDTSTWSFRLSGAEGDEGGGGGIGNVMGHRRRRQRSSGIVAGDEPRRMEAVHHGHGNSVGDRCQRQAITLAEPSVVKALARPSNEPPCTALALATLHEDSTTTTGDTRQRLEIVDVERPIGDV